MKRQPPSTISRKVYSMEAEQCLLGALLIDCNTYPQVAVKKLFEGDFYNYKHNIIFHTILQCVQENQKWDTVIIGDMIAQSNKKDMCDFSYLIEITKNTPSTANIEGYANIVKDRAILRNLLDYTDRLANMIQENPEDKTADEIMQICTESIINLRASKLLSTKATESLQTKNQQYLKYLKKRIESDKDMEGILTGLPSVDMLTGGLCNSHMIVIAARPSVGKSALGLYISIRALMQGMHVLFWSTEMDDKSIFSRLYSNLLDIPAHYLTHDQKKLKPSDLEKIERSETNFENFYIEEGYANVHDVCHKARVQHKAGKLNLLIVDYLQNLKGSGDNMVEKVGYISTCLKQLAMELDIPVVTLAQLNRAAQHMEVPSMAEIKGSGAIEQDADLILILHRNEKEMGPEKYWLICAKNRHGETKDIPIRFFKRYQDFKEDNSPGRFLSKKSLDQI